MKDLIDILEFLEKQINVYWKMIGKTKVLSRVFQRISKNRFLIGEKINDFSNGFPYRKKDYIKKKCFKIFKIKNIASMSNLDKTNFINNNGLKPRDVIIGLSGAIGT